MTRCLTIYLYVDGNPLVKFDPAGLAGVGNGTFSATPPLHPAWNADSPSNSNKVKCFIAQYYAKAGQNPTVARDMIDFDRGERSPTIPGYDLSLRDAGHFYEAYVNPWESVVIPGYSIFKVFGFDYPQASRPTISEIYWAERGALDGVFGGIPSSAGCGCGS